MSRRTRNLYPLGFVSRISRMGLALGQVSPVRSYGGLELTNRHRD